jgi:23S rRNA (cytosine1962-C5)-methyltransferase
MENLILKPGREKALHRKHPWVFSGAVEEYTGGETAIDQGATVKIVARDHKFLGWGAYSPHSQIRARVWSWEENEIIDQDFFVRRLKRAHELRVAMNIPDIADAYRLVHGESDELPGIIIDQYNRTLVLQLLSAGAEYWRETIINVLPGLTGCSTIFERSDQEVRNLEGLDERVGVLWGEEVPELIEINELGKRFLVDIRDGQKTGFYLDQRDNRAVVSRYATGKEVLDCFSYTGGFLVSALKGGAQKLTSIESSHDAMVLARRNISLNGYDPDEISWIEGDVFKVLRTLRDKNAKYDLIILDPPKFAQTAAQAERAAHGYKDINLLAFKLLNPGGFLVTFSCSGGVTEDLFQKIVAGAALDAGVDARIVQRLHQAPDHPVALNFPEGAYLKGFVIKL